MFKIELKKPEIQTGAQVNEAYRNVRKEFDAFVTDEETGEKIDPAEKFARIIKKTCTWFGINSVSAIVGDNENTMLSVPCHLRKLGWTDLVDLRGAAHRASTVLKHLLKQI